LYSAYNRSYRYSNRRVTGACRRGYYARFTNGTVLRHGLHKILQRRPLDRVAGERIVR
jgi:hypothetical protein